MISAGPAITIVKLQFGRTGRLITKLCKLVFVLGTPELIHRVYSRHTFWILKGQLGIAAFIFLLICARTVSLEGYILNADLRSG